MEDKPHLDGIASFILFFIEQEVSISPWEPHDPKLMLISLPCNSPYFVGDLSTYIGEQIRIHRKHLGMTQEKLAQLMYEDAGQVSRHEHGEGLTVNILPLYAHVLKCELSDLLPPEKKDLYLTLEDRIARIVKQLLTVYDLPPEESEDVVTIIERTLKLAVPKSKALPDRDEK